MRHVMALTAFAVVLGWATIARALITPHLVEVPISPAAVSADPALANFRTWDLRITVPQDDAWLVAGFRTTLSEGIFYSPVGGGDVPVLNPAANVLFDTYVTGPGYNPATPTNPLMGIPGRFTTVPGAAIFPRAGQQQTVLDAAWGVLPPANTPGEHTIARFTITNTADAIVDGKVVTRNTLGQFSPEVDTELFFNTTITDGMFAPIIIPEPGLVMLLPAGLLLLLRR